MIKRLLVLGAAVWFAAPTIANAHSVAQTHFLETAKPYAPYEFLIGDWYSKLAGQDMVIHQQFKWGPGKSYIIYSSYLVPSGKPEQLHFEGMMVWNGKSKALDFLFAVQPGSGAQEKGIVSAQADGTIIREVEMTDDDGDRDHFRQTFKALDGKVVTSVMKQSAKGWESSPPGEIVMEKKSSSNATTTTTQ